jgi:type II secretory pathway component GspD/PulD (secretin)
MRLFALALVFIAGTAHAAAEVYKVKHRPAEELLPIAETVLAGEGSVAVDPGTNSLVLVGEPEALARVLALLDGQDRALRNVVLHYASRRARDLESEGIAIAWSVDAGDVRVGNVRRREGADVRVEAVDAAKSDELRGTLRVLEGREGRISTGSLIPFQIGRRWQRDTVLVEAETGIEVHPRILGDGKVQLDLRPFEATPTAGGVIQGASAETTVVVTPGESVALGGVDTGSQTSARSPVSGAARATESEARLLLIRVEIE